MGVVQCFYGMQILIPLLFVVSSFAGFVFCLMFFNEVFISPDTSTVWFWMVVFLSVFCGGAIGYFAMIIPKYGQIFNIFLIFRVYDIRSFFRSCNCFGFR